MVKVSVIMPLYNVEEFLHRSLDSVLGQEFEDLEVICVNDGSKDATADILKIYAEKDKRVRVFHQENSGRAAIPMNKGLDYATGDYIFILSGDDEISKDLFKKAVARAEETNADITLCDMLFIYPDNSERNWSFIGVTEKFGNTNEVIDRSVVLSGREAVKLTLRGWHVHAKGIYRRKLFDNIRYEEEGMNGDEFTTRNLFMSANKIVFTEGEHHYFQTPGSITRKITSRFFDVFKTDERLQKLLEDNKFEEDIIKDFYNARIKKLYKYWKIYYCNRSEFSKEEREKIETILRFAVDNLNLRFGAKMCMFVKKYAPLKICKSGDVRKVFLFGAKVFEKKNGLKVQ